MSLSCVELLLLNHREIFVAAVAVSVEQEDVTIITSQVARTSFQAIPTGYPALMNQDFLPRTEYMVRN